MNKSSAIRILEAEFSSGDDRIKSAAFLAPKRYKGYQLRRLDIGEPIHKGDYCKCGTWPLVEVLNDRPIIRVTATHWPHYRRKRRRLN